MKTWMYWPTSFA